MLPIADPVLPLLSTELPVGRNWRYELKLNGFRGMLYADGGSATFRSKTKRPMPRFDELAVRIAAELDVRDAVLDGEIVVMGARGPEFNALLFNRGVPQFAAFDLVWLNGCDLRAWPYERRKGALKRLVRRSTPSSSIYMWTTSRRSTRSWPRQACAAATSRTRSTPSAASSASSIPTATR